MTESIEMANMKDPEIIDAIEPKDPAPSKRLLSKGVILYILSVACASLMHATSKLLLEQVGTEQAIQIRMAITTIITISLMHFKAVDHNILGSPEHRPLLLARGTLGFINFALAFYSLQYLKLPDVAALGFLTPLCTLFAAGLFLGEVIIWQQIVCSFISLIGVLIIARPPALFGGEEVGNSAQRTVAVCACLVSVIGTGAVTILLRKLKNAHPMQTVGAYAAVSTVGSSVVLAAKSAHSSQIPGYPHNWRSWGLIAAMSSFGFALQYLQSMALSLEEASYLVNFRYTSLIWATLWEFLLWHDWPDIWTLTGTAIVLASVLYSAMVKR